MTFGHRKNLTRNSGPVSSSILARVHWSRVPINITPHPDMFGHVDSNLSSLSVIQIKVPRLKQSTSDQQWMQVGHVWWTFICPFFTQRMAMVVFMLLASLWTLKNIYLSLNRLQLAFHGHQIQYLPISTTCTLVNTSLCVCIGQIGSINFGVEVLLYKLSQLGSNQVPVETNLCLIWHWTSV